MDYLLLGPLQVIGDDGKEVPVSWPARRALLAVLLLYAGRPCSRRLLIESLWGRRPPKDPVLSLRSHISRLRTEVGLGSRLHLGRPGAAAYQLEVGDGELDLHRFRQRSSRGLQLAAVGDLERAAALLASALSCWREPPLADLPSPPSIHADVVALLEQRRTTEAHYIDAMLALGRHQEVIADLRRATTIDPLDEVPAAQLIEALYMAGRKREALAAYSHTRGALLRSLRVTPSPRLTGLYSAILADSPVLPVPRQPRPGGAALRQWPPAAPAAAPVAGYAAPVPYGSRR